VREIKFRAWDSKAKEMDYSDPLDDLSRSYRWFYSLEDRDSSNNIFLMQFTGLKDKNGKEIYEGDIVHFIEKFYPKFKNFRIRWGDGAWEVYAELPNEDNLWFALDRDLAFKAEVIGNVWENPELIKEDLDGKP
jgi:uncharacterized phage protein (TIGR01671 family)